MIKSKYISLDEFQEYFPDIDLRGELGSEENALSFLTRIENRMEAFINSNFSKNIEFMYPAFTDYQKIHYKRALLEQAIYIFRNGDLSVDSGIDEDGKKLDRADIKKASLSQNAIDELRLCGLWNRNIRSSNLGLGWWWIR